MVASHQRDESKSKEHSRTQEAVVPTHVRLQLSGKKKGSNSDNWSTSIQVATGSSRNLIPIGTKHRKAVIL